MTNVADGCFWPLADCLFADIGDVRMTAFRQSGCPLMYGRVVENDGLSNTQIDRNHPAHATALLI